MLDLILIGGGGHCRSCIDVIEAEGRFNIVGILDRNDQIGQKISDYQVVGDDSDILSFVNRGIYFLITIGQIESPESRIRLFNLVKKFNGKLATVISPRAYVAKSASVGEGTIILHDALVNADVSIKYNCIINSKALIEHDCNILSHCHISTSSVVNGGVTIGEGTFFGSNAVSKQGISIPPYSFIRAGSCFTYTRASKKVAFLTTIFPMKIEYVFEFFDSLMIQTESRFDIIVMNDGFDDFKKIKKRYNKLHIIELEAVGSIANNRETLIRFAKVNQYDIAIFGDIDDFFSNDRVEKSIIKLSQSDIVVNELTAVKNGSVIADSIYSKRLEDMQDVGLEFILDKNIFGLSNTAVNLSIVSMDDIKFSDELIAVDWFFFSTLLLNGAKAKFTNEIVTFYRQHQRNTIGIGRYTSDKIKTILNVKKTHCKFMSMKSDIYVEEFADVNLYLNTISNESFLKSALTINSTTISHPLWWELVKFKDIK